MTTPKIDELNARFDARMHKRIRNAQTIGDWLEVRGILARARVHNNLRPEVHLDFCLRCPSGLMLEPLEASPAPAPEVAPVPGADLEPKGGRYPAKRKPRVKRKGAEALAEGVQGRGSGYVVLGAIKEAYQHTA